MTLTANTNGSLNGKFTIPANIPAGSKSVVFLGKGGTRGEAVFTGQGMLNITTYRNVTTMTNNRYDPLAQTFTINRAVTLAGVDLWFTAKDTQVRVQIREVSVGMPTQIVLGEAILEPADIIVTGGGHTRVLFPAPISLSANAEYAFIVLCDDPTTKLSIAQMGKFDKFAQAYVTAQPYSVGVLLSSSNASTWTPHQDKDLAFRLLEAVFSGEKNIELGEVSVTNATDIMLLALSDSPSSAARISYKMSMGDNVITVDESQPVRLAEPYTGTVQLSAKMTGDSLSSPALFPGSQILCGGVLQSADYFTRSVVASHATKAVLIYDAIIPSGANVTPTIQIDSGAYVALASDGTTQMGDGRVEYRFRHALNEADLIKVKLVLTGNCVARPMVQNIRLMAAI